MTDPLTHRDLNERLEELKLEFIEMRMVLVRIDERMESRDREHNNHHERITRLEDRSWQTIMGAAGGALGILAALATAIISLL